MFTFHRDSRRIPPPERGLIPCKDARGPRSVPKEG